jgi:hypothetical protein
MFMMALQSTTQCRLGGLEKIENMFNRAKIEVLEVLLMHKTIKIMVHGVITLFLISSVFSCQSANEKEGIHVMFDGTPKIYHSQVFYQGQVVGQIQDQQIGNGSVTKVTIRIDPQFEQYSGRHWAFYADSGRLMAGKLVSSGEPMESGDRVCGFRSKAAFHWFKVKTLLSDRVSKAERQADKLFRKFNPSA